ncbi:MAG TPA: twin-arginine translocase subunit TatC [Actinomycetota bacterium]
MTVLEHLEEFRRRLIISLAAVLAGGIIAYVLYVPILDFLRSPLDEAGEIGGVSVNLYLSGVTTGFVLRLKVSAFAGVILALPVVMFQLWRFITPGLDRRERRYAIPFVVSAVVLFALGTYMAFLVMPVGIKFLLGFVEPAEPLLQLPEYLSFVMVMVIGFGAAFEFPLVLVFLGLVGVVSSRALGKRRRLALLLAFVVAAFATPSGDPLTQTMMAVPLYILYELSIVVIRFVLKR